MDLKTIYKTISEGLADSSSYTDKFALSMVSSVNGVILARYDEPAKTMSVRVMSDRPFGSIINEIESILGVDINQNPTGTYNGVEIDSPGSGTYADEYSDTEHAVSGNPDLIKVVFSYVDPTEGNTGGGISGIDISQETPEKYNSDL